MSKLIKVIILISMSYGFSQNHEYFEHEKLSPNDYLFGSFGKKEKSIFDDYREVKLEVDLGISQDCGRLDFGKTLRHSVKNILSTKYIEDVGKDIIGASPLLLMAYLSPTWAAIMSQARLRGNFHAGLRLNQCALINKYIDQRNDDYMAERSKCIQKHIKKYDGNMEEAVEKCKNYQNYNLSSWSGDGRSRENSLNDSSMRWAGLSGKKAKRASDLAKAFIGDTIIRDGKLSVSFGPQKVQISPKTYMSKIQRSTYTTICKKILKKFETSSQEDMEKIINSKEVESINKNSERPYLDFETIRSLRYLPPKKREIACAKLSEAISLSIFTEDMQNTLDIISTAPLSNPNLSRKRIEEVNLKRKVLKDQIEMTLALHQNKSAPVSNVLTQINFEGEKYRNLVTEKILNGQSAQEINLRAESLIMDCSDPIFCSN